MEESKVNKVIEEMDKYDCTVFDDEGINLVYPEWCIRKVLLEF